MADVEALPVDAIVPPVLGALDAGTFEIYVPEWFADVVGAKFPDVGTYLAGNISYFKLSDDDRANFETSLEDS
jgi:hypothetical protein